MVSGNPDAAHMADMATATSLPTSVPAGTFTLDDVSGPRPLPRRPIRAAYAARQSLAAVNPGIIAQWHPELNGDLTPEDFTPSSNQKAWWICEAGTHPPYFARISNRNDGSGCPGCGRERTIAGSTTPRPGRSLAEANPQLAAEWDHEANGEITPDMVCAGSNRPAAWICPEGHPGYTARPISRSSGIGCPVCGRERRLNSRTLPAPGRSVAEKLPKVAAEWDAAANTPRTPADVAATSKRVYSWLCPEGHPPYRMRVVDRFHSNGCPVCLPHSAKRVVTD